LFGLNSLQAALLPDASNTMTTFTRRGVTFIEPKSNVRLLHTLCSSSDPVEVKLPAICEALAAGEDPNELGGWKNPGIQRPLHYAICDVRLRDYRDLKHNLLVVELLLQHGADPRLPDYNPARSSLCSPIQVLEGETQNCDIGSFSGQPERLEYHLFYCAALRLMKARAVELDGEHHISVWTTLESAADYDRNSSRRETDCFE
jgi:hypothetical protein